MTYDRRRFLELSGITLGALTGCVSVSAPNANETPVSTPTQTETSTPTPSKSLAQQKFPKYEWNLLENATPTVTTRIKMTKDLRFRPTIAKVPEEATVTWVNPSFKHTLVIPALNIKREVAGGEQTTVTVKETGSFDYVCDIHPPKMLGRLLVVEDVQTSTATPTATATPTVAQTPKQAAEVPEANGAITIEGSEWKLVPAKFTTQKGRQLKITFKNVGSVAHNLTIGDFPVEERSAAKQDENTQFMAKTETIQPGKTASVTITPDTAGAFPYWCDVSGHRHAGMEGRMIVER